MTSSWSLMPTAALMPAAASSSILGGGISVGGGNPLRPPVDMADHGRGPARVRHAAGHGRCGRDRPPGPEQVLLGDALLAVSKCTVRAPGRGMGWPEQAPPEHHAQGPGVELPAERLPL